MGDESSVAQGGVAEGAGAATEAQPPAEEEAGLPLLDMRTAVYQAVNWHPAVANSVGSLFQSEESIEVARAGYYPQVRAGIGSDFSNRNIGTTGNRRQHSLSLSASQTLYDFGKVDSTVERAGAGYTAARARLLLSIDDLIQDTLHALVEVQRYGHLVRLAQAQASGVTALADLARERQALGASTLSDVTQAATREDAARATVLEMQAQWSRWNTSLQHLTGLPAGAATVDGDDAPEFLHGACRLEAVNWEDLPTVRLAQAEEAAAVAGLRLAEANTLPTLALEASVSRRLNSVSRASDNGRHDATLGLNFSVPLYEGGGLQASSRSAAHALTAAEAATRQARLAASQSFEDAREQSQGYAQRTAVLNTRIGNIDQTRELYRQQYLDMGTRSLLDLLNAEQEFHSAYFDQVNNLYDLRRQQIACLHDSGRLREVFELEGAELSGVEIRP
ncbi:outer membrane protein, adhesin transport system [Lampropedia hyalina DSM 16112]|uniref:Outer membrane protein, adhesin transport system n=1 Tax=Lampropedia hyalina DSM 16112 TaxID=1122156 RepID=A0A1M4W4J1_9BURK|nr:outer membrane protein, adhesin transport system [Lampropedia hyalina DSM 16112]